MRLFFDKYGKHHELKGETTQGFQATVLDYFHTMKRGPAIINLKDAGLILSFTGVSDGWKVIEAGSGSGALTMMLANAVKPSGKVYSCDVSEKHLKIAKDNIERAQLTDFVDFKDLNVYEELPAENADLIVLDLAEPWKAFNNAEKALKEGGFIVCYVPSAEQLKECVLGLKKRKFVQVKPVESILREYKVEENVTRPNNVGLMHTAFLVFARKQ